MFEHLAATAGRGQPSNTMKTQSQIFTWLRNNCGKKCLSPLTSQDTTALLASVALCPLISYQNAPLQLFIAYGNIVLEMQPGTRWLAYNAIAIELDWSHRSMIWRRAGLPEGDKPSQLCAFEPLGKMRPAKLALIAAAAYEPPLSAFLPGRQTPATPDPLRHYE